MTDVKYTYAHAAIVVSDIERSATFYERAVGWQREFPGEFDDALGVANGFHGPGRILMGKLGGVPLELVEMKAPAQKLTRKARQQDHYGLFMCSVMVEKLGPARERLTAAQIPITRQVDIGGIRLLVVTDPDGQEVGIIGPAD